MKLTMLTNLYRYSLNKPHFPMMTLPGGSIFIDTFLTLEQSRKAYFYVMGDRQGRIRLVHSTNEMITFNI